MHISSRLFLYEIWVGEGAESGSGVVAGWGDGGTEDGGVPLEAEVVVLVVVAGEDDEEDEEEGAVKGLNSMRQAPVSRFHAVRVKLLAATRKGNSSATRERTNVCLRCPWREMGKV